MTTEISKKKSEENQKQYKPKNYYNVCSFCDYGPYGHDDCPKPHIQEERIKEGFCGFADIDGCQARITKDHVVVHNVYCSNFNLQKITQLEDVKISKDCLLMLKDTLNKVPREHRKKETPSPSVLSELFDGLEANV